MIPSLDVPAASRIPAPSLVSGSPFVSHIETLTDRFERSILQDTQPDSGALTRLVDRLVATSPIGFRPLGLPQLLRRLHRRMRSTGITDLDTYCTYAIEQPDELAQLRRHLHVRSSRFFSDPEAFYVLERYALLALFATGTLQQRIRILVTGNGSGEEAYGIAMLFLEYARCLERPPVLELHAVENDPSQVETARRGVYPRTISDDLSPACLDRYFAVDSEGFTVRREIRDVVTIYEGAPPENAGLEALDLIVSRNAVLLMDPVRQDELLRSCHARLRPGGYLLLGAPLTAEEAPAFFERVVVASSLYRRRDLTGDIPAPLQEHHLSEAQLKRRTQGLIAYARHVKDELFQSEERTRMAREYAEAHPEADPRDTEWKQLQRRAFEQLHDAVIVTNRDLHVLFANDAAARRYGIDRERAAGRNLGDLIQIDWPTPEDRKRAYDTLVTQGSWVGQQVHRTPTGGIFDVETAASLLRDGTGEEIGLLISVRDVRHRGDGELEGLRSVIEAIDRMPASSHDGAPLENSPLPQLRPNRPPRERFLFWK